MLISNIASGARNQLFLSHYIATISEFSEQAIGRFVRGNWVKTMLFRNPSCTMIGKKDSK
jgi:hypothetical protein